MHYQCIERSLNTKEREGIFSGFIEKVRVVNTHPKTTICLSCQDDWRCIRADTLLYYLCLSKLVNMILHCFMIRWRNPPEALANRIIIHERKPVYNQVSETLITIMSWKKLRYRELTFSWSFKERFDETTFFCSYNIDSHPHRNETLSTIPNVARPGGTE